MAIDFEELANAIVKGDMETATSLTAQGLEDGKADGREDLVVAKEVLNKGLIGGMDIISELWVQEKIFIPEVLISAKVMHSCMDLLRPILEASDEPPRGIMVIGTVKGDLHDIGKNLVAMMMEGAGFNVVDLGVDVDAKKFVTAARDNGAGVIALSALLTTTMPAMRETVKLLRESDQVDAKIMVGGAPITPTFAEEIGADGYAADAGSAVEVAQGLVAA